MADEKFAVFAENMHCLLFWMERVTMLVYVFLSQHNAMLFTSLLFLFINEHYTYFNFYGVTSGYYTPKTIISNFWFAWERVAEIEAIAYYGFGSWFPECWIIITVSFAATNIYHILSYFFSRRPIEEDFDTLNPSYFHYVFVLERIAMALVALDYFPSLSFKSCWVLATIIFAGTNIFRILAYYFDGRRPAQEDFGSLNPTDPEGEEVEKEKVGIREESSSNLKCLEEILETIDHDEEIVKAEDNLDVVQGITQNRCSEEPKIELDKVVEEKEGEGPVRARLHKARENYNKLFSSWVEVKNNLQASLESSGKQLLKWEEDKQELLAQIKHENARKELYKQLDTSDKSWQHYQNNERSSAESYKLQEERGDLQAQLLTATSTYWHRVNRLTEEKNDLESKLDAANSKVEYYDEGWKDCEETCSKLKEENLKLSVLLSCETASVARVNELMHKLEEKCRRLEEEKINLTADLCASKAIAEIYRNCMHDLDC
ncbi:hypothetical protein GH714_029414 [Hevea brasiliensis]|uniref:Uncharacterized protein n=1 Tax=Hevea brasiliensis TaxID=3981 RepID=A0A6A6NCN7_HEVBR|nr:hypothetical protein GH714_029414 [Hevea brasiliensis]